ncbi:MAG: L-ribulose-5-phosphate 4-epimerase [Meiothermus sp.]|nr:L-ribulose-5-phosphate 4-epimerase [Meiothermus sp.]
MHTLKQQVFQANLELVRLGLVLFTWGNASAVDRASGLVAIKPSGVPYDAMRPEDMVLVELSTGQPVDSMYRPSSDTPTHLEIYRAFPEVGGVVHTHSRHATAWAQAGRELPPFGTTHADHFYGPVPCVPPLSEAEIEAGYERQTGLAIARTFKQRGLRPLEVPAALLHGHAPFAWGQTVAEAVHNAAVLEAVAGMALATLALDPDARPILQALLDKHYLRKHGDNAYYGQRA